MTKTRKSLPNNKNYQKWPSRFFDDNFWTGRDKERFERNRVPFVETHRKIFLFRNVVKVWSQVTWLQCQVRSNWVKCIGIIRCVLTSWTPWDHARVCLSFLCIVIGKKERRDLWWPGVLFEQIIEKITNKHKQLQTECDQYHLNSRAPFNICCF